MKQAVSRQRVWQTRNPLKDRAHKLVAALIKSGKIQRGLCWCGAIGESHHEDYARPQEITWLCPQHHRARHAEIKARYAVAEIKPKRARIDERNEFKSLILKWRTSRKLTQAKAAALLGVHWRTFQDWEYGRRTPRGLALELITDKLSNQ
jgi:DNA-binding transcriptional regulator YiaG